MSDLISRQGADGPSAQPESDKRLGKIVELVDGTIDHMSNLKKFKKLEKKLKKSRNELTKKYLQSGNADILDAIHALNEFRNTLNYVALPEKEWKSDNRMAEIDFCLRITE